MSIIITKGNECYQCGNFPCRCTSNWSNECYQCGNFPILPKPDTTRPDEPEDRNHDPQSIQITIRTLTSKTIKLEVKSNDSIENVKEQIFDVTNMSVDKQCLIFGGKQMVDYLKISDYNIYESTTLYLVFRLRGAFDPSRYPTVKTTPSTAYGGSGKSLGIAKGREGRRNIG